MPQILLTGQLKEKPTYRVLCLYSSLVYAPTSDIPGHIRKAKKHEACLTGERRDNHLTFAKLKTNFLKLVKNNLCEY